MAILNQNSQSQTFFSGWYGTCEAECENLNISTSSFRDKIYKIFQIRSDNLTYVGFDGDLSQNLDEILQPFSEFECGKAYIIILKSGTGQVDLPHFKEVDNESTDAGRATSDCSGIVSPTYNLSIFNEELQEPNLAFPRNENESFIFKLSTTGLNQGFPVKWEISGSNITLEDFVTPVSLNGNFILDNNGEAFLAIEMNEDLLLESSETFRMRLVDHPNVYIDVPIDDSSTGVATYSLTTSSESIDEGSSSTLNLKTTYVPAGTPVAFKISGNVTLNDFEDLDSLGGEFIVDSNGDANFELKINKDKSSEIFGTESFQVSIDGIDGLDESVTININDTSKDPTYTLKSNVDSVDEGGTIILSLSTTDVDQGTVIPFTISGENIDINDFIGLDSLGAGEFIVDSNGDASFELKVNSDKLTENENGETFLVRLDGSLSYIVSSININDTSKNPKYALSSVSVSGDEGTSITLSLSTTDVDRGTPVPFTISGDIGISPENFIGLDSHGSGEFIVDSNGDASFEFILIEDSTTTEINSLTVNFEDVNIPNQTASVETYTLTSSSYILNEGGTITLSLSTTKVDQGTVIPFTISGENIDINDFVGLDSLGAGEFIIDSNGDASFELEVNSDKLTENGETFFVFLDGLDESVTININDTSKNPTYTLKSNVDSVDEGGTIILSLSTTDVDQGTVIPFTISGENIDINDFIGLDSLGAGEFIVDSNGDASFELKVNSDKLTENENGETFLVRLDGSLSYIVSSININDTSKTSIFNLKSKSYSVNEGTSFTLRLETENVDQGTVIPFNISGDTEISPEDFIGLDSHGSGEFIVDSNGDASFEFILIEDSTTTEINSLTVNFEDVNIPNEIISTQTYSLSSSLGSADEGETITLSLSTTKVDQGTSIPFTISGENIDINDFVGLDSLGAGEFIIDSNGDASFELEVNSDKLTENGESFRVNLDGLDESVTINIKDTSKNPTYTLTSNVDSADEGETIILSLSTTDVDQGTVIPFTISGENIDINDFVGLDSLGAGEFIIDSNGDASFELKIKADKTSEDLIYSELFRVNLDGLDESITININDTSKDPTYTLTSNVDFADEGETIILSLSTTDVDQGTVIPFSIIGDNIDPNDFIGLDSLGAGEFIVDSNGDASFELKVNSDKLTENDESFFVFLDGLDESVTINIKDTSKNPTYELSSNQKSFSEGSEGTFVVLNLSTTDVDQGTVIPFTISGENIDINDFIGLDSLGAGEFIVDSNGDASFELKIKADSTTEGPEIFTVKLDSHPDVSVDVRIIDTSISPSYKLSRYGISDIDSANEGVNLIILLETISVPEGTIVPFTITSLVGDVNISDFSNLDSLGSGEFEVNNCSRFISTGPLNCRSLFNLSIKLDEFTEGNEKFRITLDNHPEVFLDFTINDISRTPITYNLSYTLPEKYDEYGHLINRIYADEGEIITLNLKTTGLEKGEIIPFSIKGPWSNSLGWSESINSNDFVGLDSLGAGEFIVDSNGDASFELKVNSDGVTEGDESFWVVLDVEDDGKYPIPVATGVELPGSSIEIGIRDTSKDPKYIITPSSDSVGEGSSLFLTLSKSDGSDLIPETIIPFTIVPVPVGKVINNQVVIVDSVDISDFSNLDSFGAGEFIVDQFGNATFELQINPDGVTEGLEYFNVVLDHDPTQSIRIVINDESIDAPTYQLYTLNYSGVNDIGENQISADEGTLIEFRLITYNIKGSGNPVVPFTLSFSNGAQYNDFLIYPTTESIPTYNGQFILSESDMTPLTSHNGEFILSESNSNPWYRYGIYRLFIKKDKTSELLEGNEKLKLTLNVDGVNEFIEVNINDTSRNDEIYSDIYINDIKMVEDQTFSATFTDYENTGQIWPWDFRADYSALTEFGRKYLMNVTPNSVAVFMDSFRKSLIHIKIEGEYLLNGQNVQGDFGWRIVDFEGSSSFNSPSFQKFNYYSDSPFDIEQWNPEVNIEGVGNWEPVPNIGKLDGTFEKFRPQGKIRNQGKYTVANRVVEHTNTSRSFYIRFKRNTGSKEFALYRFKIRFTDSLGNYILKPDGSFFETKPIMFMRRNQFADHPLREIPCIPKIYSIRDNTEISTNEIDRGVSFVIKEPLENSGSEGFIVEFNFLELGLPYFSVPPVSYEGNRVESEYYLPKIDIRWELLYSVRHSPSRTQLGIDYYGYDLGSQLFPDPFDENGQIIWNEGIEREYDDLSENARLETGRDIRDILWEYRYSKDKTAMIYGKFPNRYFGTNKTFDEKYLEKDWGRQVGSTSYYHHFELDKNYDPNLRWNEKFNYVEEYSFEIEESWNHVLQKRTTLDVPLAKGDWTIYGNQSIGYDSSPTFRQNVDHKFRFAAIQIPPRSRDTGWPDDTFQYGLLKFQIRSPENPRATLCEKYVQFKIESTTQDWERFNIEYEIQDTDVPSEKVIIFTLKTREIDNGIYPFTISSLAEGDLDTTTGVVNWDGNRNVYEGSFNLVDNVSTISINTNIDNLSAPVGNILLDNGNESVNFEIQSHNEWWNNWNNNQ